MWSELFGGSETPLPGRVVIELNGYTFDLDIGGREQSGGKEQMNCSISGPGSTEALARSFVRFTQSPGAWEIMGTYHSLKSTMIERIGVPALAKDPPRLADVSSWLRENPKFIDAVAEALAEHGFTG